MKEGQYVTLKEGVTISPIGYAPGTIFPKPGKIYTIRNISGHNGIFGLLLVEIINKPVETRDLGFSEQYFSIKAFEVVEPMDIKEVLHEPEMA